MSASSLPKLAVSIQPLGDRVVVVPIEAEQVTASGIVIPDTAKGEKPQEGVVIALGKGGINTSEGKVSNPHDFLKVGDKVLFGKYSGDEVKLKDKNNKDVEVKILRLDSVLGIVS
jgi:chaperonin GroES